MSDDTVRVALRVRPLVPSEIEKGCRACISVVPGEQQIQIQNSDKSFTFNYVFGPEVEHEEFYDTAVKRTVQNIFKGYNVTILAYGQTGSGKTFSMGTNYSGKESMGIIPRAVNEIFDTMASKSETHTFKVSVSFMELYQEQLYDLLADKERSERVVDIREDNKGIKIVGLTERGVNNADEALRALMLGSNERATGATAMNQQSSRSHAIFTLIIHQIQNSDSNSATTSKFHLVDLAGSERSKKTQATGERFKEGVNINKGLLALGNVISQLGEGGATTYIGYRDSKLTRILQDSLGGNSVTLMIACISPADYNLDETLSTLRYADRARKIKNKPIVNQDPKAAEINRLNAIIQELRLALVGQGTFAACPPEHANVQEKNRELQMKLRELTEKLNISLVEIVNMHERAELAEQARENTRSELSKLVEEFDQILKQFDASSSELALLEPFYKKMLSLQDDQKKRDDEIHKHQLTAMCSNDGDNSNQESLDGSNFDENDDRNDLDEKHAEHTLRQAERNNEVQNINHTLVLKEELISTLLKNSSQFAEHSKEVQLMESEIKTLQSEKEELMQALQNVQSNTASAKLAASRRKKVQELEKKITELTRKCTEQTRIIKKKEQTDEQIKGLSTEIVNLKKTRIRLIREMRKESETFSKWKRSSEREMHRLKDQNRKRQNEIAKLQSQKNQQQNVFRRKLEEVYATNKRLKDALESKREKNVTGKEGIRDWVQQESAIVVSTVDAKCTLKKLMQDRADWNKQLETLKANSENNPFVAEQMTMLKEYIDLHSIQIADLQKKIMESDQENRGNSRLSTLQSMSDAKNAVKALFETLALNQKKKCLENQELENKYTELMEKYDSALLKNRQYELRHAPPEKVKELEEQLESYKEKCERLEKENFALKTPPVLKERKKANTIPKTQQDYVNADESFHITDDSFTEDDDNDDPDWKKTPLYKRIQKVRKSRMPGDELSIAAKRSSDGEVKCACKGQCLSRLCSCRKNAMNCNNCNCNPEVCQNRNTDCTRTLFFTDSIETSQITNADEPSKRPRIEE